MKIDDVKTYPVTMDRDEVFKIATGSSLAAENVHVKISAENYEGWGNASPNSVTEETTDSILKSLNIMKKKVTSKELDIEKIWKEMTEIFPKDPAAVAGLDIALNDLKGKLEDKPVCGLYGGERTGVLTDRTISIWPYQETVDHAKRYVEQGFKALKMKIGLDLFEDIRRVRAVREEVGDSIRIWVDANQGYKVEEAITLCEKLADLDVELIEQPVNKDDLDGLKRVTHESAIPIMADEAVKDHNMAEKICSEEIADMVNIKLMKCGGITGGRKIIEVLEEYGVDAMVGCMGEDVPAIAAGTHLHLTSSRITHADLDSHFMLPDRIAGGLDFKEGYLYVSEKPGLGIDVFKDKLERYRLDVEVVD